MSHFEGQLPQNHTEREGFDAWTLQREIFCAETPEMMGGKATDFGAVSTQTSMIARCARSDH